MVDPPPSGNIITYSWNIEGCYLTFNNERRCFPFNQTTQNVTGGELLAEDAGTITCTVTIDGIPITSSQFTLRISGICSCTGSCCGCHSSYKFAFTYI